MIPNTSSLRTTCTLIALLSMGSILAQTPGMIVFGAVRDMDTRDSIPFPIITVEEIGSNVPPVTIGSTARGRYEFALTAQNNYLIRYDAVGKVTKSVRMELNGPGAEDWATGYGMQLDITLMDSLPGVDYSVLSAPFGIARFNKDSGYYEWDIEHTRSMSDRMKVLLGTHQERSGAPEGGGR